MSVSHQIMAVKSLPEIFPYILLLTLSPTNLQYSTLDITVEHRITLHRFETAIEYEIEHRNIEFANCCLKNAYPGDKHLA